MGVNLFFVLSGFLITGILFKTRTQADYYRSFYIRRALRILPLYYSVLVVLAVLPPIEWKFVGLSFVFLSNVTGFFGVPLQYGVLWTLAVEEHFYLLWPAIVRSVSRQKIVGIGIVICVLCPCLRALYFAFGRNGNVGYTWLVGDGLATGAVLAALAGGSWGTRTRMRWVTKILFATSLMMFGAGYPFGIFIGSRFLGVTLRTTALNLFFAGTILLCPPSRNVSLEGRS